MQVGTTAAAVDDQAAIAGGELHTGRLEFVKMLVKLRLFEHSQILVVNSADQRGGDIRPLLDCC